VEAPEQPTVTREERAEVSPGGLGHEAHEDDVLSCGEANRELLGKVQATFSRSVPSQVVSGSPSTTSNTMRRSTARATVAGRRCRLAAARVQPVHRLRIQARELRILGRLP
jgi:CHAD domain-containing protein